MKYRIEFRGRARKAFLALPTDVGERIRRGLDALSDDPRAGNTKPLKGDLRGLMRLRVGRYRVLYLVDHEARRIEVMQVGHRQRSYSRRRR